MIQELLGHPFTTRFAQRIHASGNNRVYSPEDVLGERLLRLGGVLLMEHERPGWIIAQGRVDGVGKDRFDLFALQTLWALEAHPYLWTEEVRTAVAQLDVPRCVLSPRLLPDAKTWHTFETGIQLGGTLEYDGREFGSDRHVDPAGNTVDAVLLLDADIGFNVMQYGEMADIETGETRPCIAQASFEYGKVYPDDFDEPQKGLLTSILLLCAFLASPYIPQQRRSPSRASRRDCVRAGRVDPDDHVTFVLLRQPVARKRDKDDDPQSIEWKHRWLVRGHVRAQWYPSEQAHRLIWIAPYLKGPVDAPMLTHAYKVAR